MQVAKGVFMQSLTSEHVHAIFMDCLFTPDEVKAELPEHIAVEGIMINIHFHPGHITQHEQEIFDMLKQLPEPFLQSKGGGWTFLAACNDRHEHLWTGEHAIMDELVCLGIACKLVRFNLPRDLWQALPGAMPYFVVLDLETGG